MKVAVIGSFRKHYDDVLACIRCFADAGWTVTSPTGSEVLEPGIDFVRFSTDDPELSDEEVQTVTLERIFSADVVYVVAPDGYVGRTTCYEIGRLVQAGHPVYFSDRPADLPIRVADQFVATPRLFVETVAGGGGLGRMHEDDDLLSRTERGLIR